MTPSPTSIERPPVVAILGHIDHGKSTLLDYIRKTHVVDTEAGGITQRLSAYEVEIDSEGGAKKRITFLDTPGHEAFSRMRAKGLEVADIAVLVVSAEDGVKAQTIEAFKTIRTQGTPCVVAITKIDKPGANVDRTKNSLIENEIYLEGLGGDIPYALLSAKTGEGVNDLLEVILLVAEVNAFTGDSEAPAEGLVIEANRDPKKGISATLIIKNGTLRAGEFVVSGTTYAPTRILQDGSGKSIVSATFSSPIAIIGFSDVPTPGTPFTTVRSKKEAEERIEMFRAEPLEQALPVQLGEELLVIPVAIKADAAGALDAVKHELQKIHIDRVTYKVVLEGIGTITENDVQNVGFGKEGLIVGFNVKADAVAIERAKLNGSEIGTFDIIYRLAEWLAEKMEARRPRMEAETKTASVKVLKIFSAERDKQVIGGRVEDGVFSLRDRFNIIRRGEHIGTGTVQSLQHLKSAVKSVETGNEFGAQVESKMSVAAGDVLESFIIEVK